MEARSLLDEKITVHPATQDPTDVWTTMKKKQKILKLKVKQPTKPVGPDKVRFVCMADTHSLTHRITFRIPDGDVFLHAGDFTRSGTRREVLEFNEWLGMLPHRRKIVIAGNHELSFDHSRAAKADGSSGLNGKPRPISASRSAHTGVVIVNPVDEEEDSAPIGSGIPRPSSATVPSASAFGANMLKNFANSLGEIEEKLAAARKPNPKSLITNALYLQDGLATVHGINIYGTPWQPDFCGWAFNLPRGQALLDKWSKIPEGIDILLSHTPPLGHGDYTITGVRAGCVELLSSVQKRIRPKYHVFGHIHEGYGITSDGNTIFINASTCNTSYQPHNLPIVFDIPLPRGHTKDE